MWYNWKHYHFISRATWLNPAAEYQGGVQVWDQYGAQLSMVSCQKRIVAPQWSAIILMSYDNTLIMTAGSPSSVNTC